MEVDLKYIIMICLSVMVSGCVYKPVYPVYNISKTVYQVQKNPIKNHKKVQIVHCNKDK